MRHQGSNTIRITVTGETGIPSYELFDSDAGLIFSVTPATTAARQPQQPQANQPTTETPPEQPASEIKPDETTGENQDPIELVVTGEQDRYRVGEASTATKTDTPLLEIPQAIQVI